MASAPTWEGWENEFLRVAQVPLSVGARHFLGDWNGHAETGCGGNPIDLSKPETGSADCAPLPGVTAKAQRYATHGEAAHAFSAQIHRNTTKALLAALESGHPYHVSNPAAVAAELTAWGSPGFAEFYAAQTAPPVPGSNQVFAYLEGGPCNGTRHVLIPAESDIERITCKGSWYSPDTPAKHHNGDIVYRYVRKAPSQSPPPTLKAPHGLGGWKALRKSVNRGMPDALTYSQRSTTAALRSLSRARKVRL